MLVELLPIWVAHLLVFIGILGFLTVFVLRIVPFINAQKITIQLISAFLVCTGVWFEGAFHNQADWEAKVAELEIKVAKAEAAAAKENTKIVLKVVKEIQEVITKGDDITIFVDREVTKFDSTCPIPVVVIKAHNAAAQNTAIVGVSN